MSNPGIFPFISTLSFWVDTSIPGILPLIFAFKSGFLPLRFTFGAFISGTFISILPEGKTEESIIPTIFSSIKSVFTLNLNLFKLIFPSTSPPNISFKVRTLFIWGPLTFISKPGIFPFIFISGLLILAFILGIFPPIFISGLLILPFILHSGNCIFGTFISRLGIDNFIPLILPDKV